jgi:hypothetical protein
MGKVRNVKGLRVEANAMDTTGYVTVKLNAELANLGAEMGLNLSKVCENALKTAIIRLQGINTENNGILNVRSSNEWTERDLNPRLPRCERTHIF